MSEYPAWWGGKPARKRQNARSRAQERRVAKDTGGRRQPGSGSSRRAPGDVKSDDELIEVKFTDKPSYRLVEEVWQKVKRDALTHGREPAMIVEFTQTGTRLKITEG